MSEKNDPLSVKSVAVSGIVNSTLISALVQKLNENGLLTDGDVRDVYDNALHSLELAQSQADPNIAEMYQYAREIIERPLNETPLPGS